MSEKSDTYGWTLGASLEEFLQHYSPSRGWVWGARRAAYAIGRNERYFVNSATPGFLLAIGVNTVCPVSSCDPGDRILLTHVNSLAVWWGERIERIYTSQLQRAGKAAAHLSTDPTSGSNYLVGRDP
ncbi:MAG: hypothetical protein ACREX3_07620 [Gammaproteobacteria bacterium]